jgi:parallel beta-helix repeat protein
MTFDCAGYNMNGNGSGVGIHVMNQENVTIRNCVMSGFYDGILVNHSNICSIINNTVSSVEDDALDVQSSNSTVIENNSLTGGEFWENSAIEFLFSSDCLISGNNLTSQSFGVYMQYSARCSLWNNLDHQRGRLGQGA